VTRFKQDWAELSLAPLIPIPDSNGFVLVTSILILDSWFQLGQVPSDTEYTGIDLLQCGPAGLDSYNVVSPDEGRSNNKAAAN